MNEDIDNRIAQLQEEIDIEEDVKNGKRVVSGFTGH